MVYFSYRFVQRTAKMRLVSQAEDHQTNRNVAFLDQRPQSMGIMPATNAQPPSAPPETRRGANSRRRPASVSRAFPPPAYPDSDEDLDDLSDPTLRILEAMSGSPFRGDMDEDRIRQHQILRGTLPTKRVASRSAIASLQSVDINSLAETERSKSKLRPSFI